MKSSCVFCVGLLCVSLVFLGGCNREEKAPVVKRPTMVEEEEERVAELGEPIGPLDQGRIEVSPPADWDVAPRDEDWIIRFKVNQRLSYPSIFVTAEDYENIFNLTRSNVDEFARQIAEAIEADPKTARLTRPIKPIEVRDLVGITYARRGKTRQRGKSIIVERLFVDTVVEGRKYNFELRARKGTLDQYRPHLMAVASGMKYLPPGGEDFGPKPE